MKFVLKLKNQMDGIHKYEKIELVENTNIEILKYPIPLLRQLYYDYKLNIVDVEIPKITVQHKLNLQKAWILIKNYAPQHYQLIESVVKKCVIFNVDTTLRNSFASLSAQGIIFFNAYQKTYNEVFFVDDIAHQSAHVIFNALLYDTTIFFILDSNTPLQKITYSNNISESRTLLILFHALYTYYASFTCLDACLTANVFNTINKHEALARIKFYINRCYNDLYIIEKAKDYKNGAKDFFTQEGLILFYQIKVMFNKMTNKYQDIVKDFDLRNQPYNFTYSKFIELNL